MARRSRISRSGSTAAGNLRIVSLLPSATEIAFALGLGESVVGVTHECDFPPEAAEKPKVTRTSLDRSVTSAEIDAVTTSHLDAGSTSYVLDETLLADLEPNLILTQMLCEVCAVPHSLVQGTLPRLRRRPKVLSLDPVGFADVLSTIKTVGDHTHRSEQARALISALRARIDRVALDVSGRAAPRVLCMEWLDPPWSAGHWVPDMVGLAGGVEVLGHARQPSRRIDWSEIERVVPEVIVFTVCGFDLPRTLVELQRTVWPDSWRRLPAVQEGRVFAVDGSAYFTRPGPRLVDGVEILAEVLDEGQSRFERPEHWLRVGSFLYSEV